MDTDIEILKTLESIEKLLKGASGAVGTGRIPVTSAERNKKASERVRGREQDQLYKATTSNLDQLNETVVGLDKSLVGLNTEVGRTTSGFGSLGASMAKFMSSLSVPDIQTPGVQTPAANGVVDQLKTMLDGMRASLAPNDVKHWFGLLVDTELVNNKSIERAVHELQQIEQNTRAPGVAVLPPLVGVTAPTPAQAPIPATAAPAAAAQQGAQAIQPLAKAVPPLVAVLEKLFGSFGAADTRLELFQRMMGHLTAAMKKVADDFFTLSSVGMGSSQNLWELSKFAFQSGMALKDYANIVSDNVTAASRAGSLDNFNKLISAADGQLAEMGVFGKEARELQGSLAQSNTLMGVSQSKLTDTIAAQVSVFDKLRKSTNMTAREFGALVQSVSDNEQVQSELVGLQGQDRAARRQDMLSLASFGQSIGMTAQASKQLADAMIEARGQTVKGRMEEAGRIRQLAQFLGMGAQGERAAQLSMKGRNRTKDEDLELQRIAGDMETATQAAYQSGTLGTQAVVDQLQEFLGHTGFGKEMKASKQATLAKDAGTVNQEAFGKHVDWFGQAVAQFVTFTKGFSDSIAPSILGALSAGTLLLFRGPIVQALTTGLSKIPGLGALGTGAGAAATTAGATAGTTAGIGSGIMNALKAVVAAPMEFLGQADLLVPIKAAAAGVKNLAGSITEFGSAIPGVAANLWQMIPSFSQMGSAAVNAFKGLSNIPSMFSGMGSSIATGAADAASSIVSGGKALWSGLQSFAGGFVLWGGIIGAAFEMFTGDISNVLDPGGGFFARIGGMVTAFFTALPNMIFDIVGFVFGESSVARYRNSFDTIVAYTNMAFKEFLGSLVGGVTGLLKKILPDDSKLVKFLDSATEGLFESALKNQRVAEALSDDQTKTFASMADANAKAADATAKKTEKATAKATAAQDKYNNVQYGMDLTQAGVVSDAKAVVGQPAVQTPPAVNPGTVNTADDAQKKADAATQAIAAVGSPEILTALNSMLALMRESLNNEQRHVALTEQLVKGNRPAAGFVSAEVMANRLLNQGQV